MQDARPIPAANGLAEIAAPSAASGSGRVSASELLEANALTRGLSIWAVVACHVGLAHAFWKPISTFASAGKLSVSIFLFLSGLLLQMQANRADGRLAVGTWLKKRFFRIYPLYWTGLALTVLCAGYFHGRTFGAGVLAANFLGVTIWFCQEVVSSGYAVTFWFVSLLLLCYVLFLLVRRIRRKEFLVLGAFALSFAALPSGCVMQAAAFALPAFFMGMAQADRLRRNGDASCDARIHLAIFLPLLGALAFVFKGPNFIQMDARGSWAFDWLGCVGLTLIPWSSLVLVAWLRKTLARRAPLLLRAALWVSGLSFAVYCIHEPLLVVVDKSSSAGHPWWGLLGYVLLVVGAGWGLDGLDRRLKNLVSPPSRKDRIP